MLKQSLVLAGLLFSLSSNAAILSVDSTYGVDSITRDTDTGLDWLDVTVTSGLSFNEVSAQLGVGGAYEGYRYATLAELDQLIINFGYLRQLSNCPLQSLHCDGPIGISYQQEGIIEDMILTMGDTWDAYLDTINDSLDVSPNGAGYTRGLLGSTDLAGKQLTGFIYDDEKVYRSDGSFAGDIVDGVHSAWRSLDQSTSAETIGSFLVAPSPVPVPAAAWLFGSAILGLAGIKRKS